MIAAVAVAVDSVVVVATIFRRIILFKNKPATAFKLQWKIHCFYCSKFPFQHWATVNCRSHSNDNILPNQQEAEPKCTQLVSAQANETNPKTGKITSKKKHVDYSLIADYISSIKHTIYKITSASSNTFVAIEIDDASTVKQIKRNWNDWKW